MKNELKLRKGETELVKQLKALVRNLKGIDDGLCYTSS